MTHVTPAAGIPVVVSPVYGAYRQPLEITVKKNIGSTDRKLRAFVLAPVLVIAGVLAGPTGWLALVAYALAAVMLATSAVSTCPLYLPFGLSTTARDSATTGASRR